MSRQTTTTLACLMVLLPLTTSLPVNSQAHRTDNSDNLNRQAVDGHSDSSLEILNARKSILERMWRENNEKIEQYKDSEKRNLVRDILSHFTDYGMSEKPPTKKSEDDEKLSIAARWFDSGPAADRPTKKSYIDTRQDKQSGSASNGIGNLRKLLTKLKETMDYKSLKRTKFSPVQVVDTSTSNPLSASDSKVQSLHPSLQSLYQKLKELDIDLHKLLREDDSDINKRGRENEVYQQGPHPKQPLE